MQSSARCPVGKGEGATRGMEDTMNNFMNVMGRDDLELKAVMAVMATFVMTGAVLLGQLL